MRRTAKPSGKAAKRPIFRRLAAWAGMAGLLLQLLLPLPALAFADAARGIPVCTAAGIVWLAPDGAPMAPAPGNLAAAPCPFCLTGAAALPPPPPPAMAPLGAVVLSRPPPPDCAALPVPATCPAHPTRAPPLAV